jgi:hypothetical protein
LWRCAPTSCRRVTAEGCHSVVPDGPEGPNGTPHGARIVLPDGRNLAEGGTHHGYFLPSEGASDKALALFTFESLTKYEAYRAHFGVDEDFIEADRLRTDTGCVLRWDRTLMRPLTR